MGSNPAAPTIGPNGRDRFAGQVDSAEFGRLRGWVIDRTRPLHPVAIELLADGEPMLQHVADRYRGDLHRGGLGDGRHAFDLAVPEPAWCGSDLAVRIAGTRLHLLDQASPARRRVGEPLQAEPGQFRGHVDEARGRRLRGWACDMDQPDRTQFVQLLDGGRPVLVAPADRLRDDLRQAGMGDGRHAFDLAVPDHEWESGELAVRIVGAAAPLPDQVSATRERWELRHRPEVARFEGAVEQADAGRLYGWARNVDDPTPVGVELLANGRVVLAASADRLHGEQGACGFDLGMPAAAWNHATLAVRIAGTGILLPDTVTPRRPLLPPAAPARLARNAPHTNALAIAREMIGLWPGPLPSTEQDPLAQLLGAGEPVPLADALAGPAGSPASPEMLHALADYLDTDRMDIQGGIERALGTAIPSTAPEVQALYAAHRAIAATGTPPPVLLALGGAWAGWAWRLGARHLVVVDGPLACMRLYAHLRRILPDAPVRLVVGPGGAAGMAPGIDLVWAGAFAATGTPWFDAALHTGQACGDSRVLLHQAQVLRGRTARLLGLGPLGLGPALCRIEGYRRLSRMRCWLPEGHVEEQWAVPPR